MGAYFLYHRLSHLSLGFFDFLALPNSPSSAFFLSKTERVLAVKRVASNETGIKNKAFHKKQGVVAFTDPKAILLFTSVFAAAIPNGVVNSFSTIIIKDMGFTTTKTTKLKSVGDAVLIVALVTGGIITLNIPTSRLLTATAANFCAPLLQGAWRICLVRICGRGLYAFGSQIRSLLDSPCPW
jgi:hypothetical protein